jgi:uncharacterized protein DUF4124
MKSAWWYELCAFTLLAFLPFPSAVAEMYKCTEDGKAVFQDTPCRGSGSAITVKPASGNTSDSSVFSRTKANVSEMERERRQREIAYEIERLERVIRGYERSQDAELTVLRYKKSYAENNFAGATWERSALEQSISTEMQAVTEKYKTKIQVARDWITQLRRDGSEIGKDVNSGVATGSGGN